VTAVDPHSPGYVASLVIGLFVLTLLYVAPTIVAASIRSRNLLAVVLVDVLLGWTVAGWIAAWVLCFSGGRQNVPSVAWPVQQPGLHGLSPDGMFWWDGIAWRDTRVVAPPHAQRSPDGYWWWDGVRWRPVPPSQPPG
jgi:Superinfection immunity protein